MTLIAVGNRLPAVHLDHRTGERYAPDASNRASGALLFVRDNAVDRARAYIATWEQALPDLKAWDARPVVITESVTPETRLATAAAQPHVWEALSIAPEAGALLIADRWGIVYFAQETRTYADLPDVHEVEDWLRYLATQCPECGVLDEPGYGEWAA